MLTAVLAVLVLTTFLPWIRSGTVLRNSYALARSADRIALIGGPIGRVAFTVWFSVPLAAATSLLALALHRRRLAALTAALAGVVVLLGAGAAVVAPTDTSIGPLLAIPSAIAVIVLAALDWRRHRG